VKQRETKAPRYIDLMRYLGETLNILESPRHFFHLDDEKIARLQYLRRSLRGSSQGST
jgi:hypothetical protein